MLADTLPNIIMRIFHMAMLRCFYFYVFLLFKVMWRCGFFPTRIYLSSSPLSVLEKRRRAMSTPIDTVCAELNDIEKCLPDEVLSAHQAALEKGSPTYKDPSSGLTVFTRQAHINRGLCCGSRCRHCFLV